MRLHDPNELELPDYDDWDTYRDEPLDNTPAFCDVYDVHEPHGYFDRCARFHRCPGLTQDERDEMDKPVEECEHGLSAWLCSGPNHYGND